MSFSPSKREASAAMSEEHKPTDASLPEASDDALVGEVVEVELAQGLGLMEALTIGIGTMIGAGIFVLPGIIIAKAGPAAVLSFLLGGVIALFNAMSVAEVATGMPKSGGGYYFISRALGPLWGAIIGWGSSFGLIFASAFYMVGFGAYVATLLHLPVTLLGVVMTVLLIIVNLTGSRAAGQAQNLIVAVLVAVLGLFILRGVPSTDLRLLQGNFMPFGLGAVIAGTATLFVSYCGFGEIASMAEEIREPGRNLPRAVLGSVIGVTVLYCVMILICVSLRPYQELGGSTIVADLAADLMGAWGRGAILLGAVAATVSSANASIMAASRVSFAMGRDGLIWDWLNGIHPRFRVPHRAIVATGLATLAVIMVGRIEILAEVSGFLHLILYGLISVACIILRGARMPAYRPVYRVPLFPIIPVLGAVGSLAVAFFMGPVSIALGAAVMVVAIGHYYLWGRRRTELRGAWPYFLRRGILERALEQVERWGAPPDELPAAVVAVGNPARERARLQIAGAMVGPSRGDILAVNVFVVDREDEVNDDVLTSYYQTIHERSDALERAAAAIPSSGARVTSHVPAAASVFYGLMTAAEASRAALVVLGWPEPTADGSDPMALVAALDKYLRAHVLVLREQGPVPASSILAIVDASIHGDLTLLTAARLANAWQAELTAGTLIAPDAAEDEITAAEEGLEARVGDLVRADVSAIPAASLADAAAEAEFYEMLVVGVSDRDDRGLSSALAELWHVEAASVLVVRAHGGRPLDLWNDPTSD